MNATFAANETGRRQFMEAIGLAIEADQTQYAADRLLADAEALGRRKPKWMQAVATLRTNLAKYAARPTDTDNPTANLVHELQNAEGRRWAVLTCLTDMTYANC